MIRRFGPCLACACAPALVGDAPCPPGEVAAFVATTDYTVGALAAVCADGDVRDGLTEIGGDPMIQVVEDSLFVLDRSGGDAIRRYPIDGPFTAPTWETGVDAPGNPHEIAAFGGSLWVTLYDAGALLRLDPTDGAVLDQVDLASFADADGIAEPDALVVADDRLWVTLQRLDRSVGWVSDGGALLPIDADGAPGAVVPTAPNPTLVRAGSGLFLRSGHWYALDGDLRPWAPPAAPGEPVATEAEIGREIAGYVTSHDGAALRVEVGLDLSQRLGCLGPDGASTGEIRTDDALFGLSSAGAGAAWVAARTSWNGGGRGAGLLGLDVAGCAVTDTLPTRLEPSMVAVVP